MSDQPKPTTWVPAHMDEKDEGFYQPKPATMYDLDKASESPQGSQPKPTGERANVHIEHYFPKGYDPGAEPWKSIRKHHNAALTAEREAREIAERSAKAWEEDAHRYVTNTENCAKVIQDLNRQLAAEREAKERNNLRSKVHDALAKVKEGKDS